MDLYYDPVVDEHVGRGPMGIITPVWYFAPQKREIAQIGWDTASDFYGVEGTERITGLEDPAKATMLLQLAGEFCDKSTKNRLWEQAEEHLQPQFDSVSGEFTFGLGLDEPYPRGQWNARIMAGWVCERGDWSKIFNHPNFAKYSEPTIEGVDFPEIALREAWWDGDKLYLTAQSKNPLRVNDFTEMRLINVSLSEKWVLETIDGSVKPLERGDDHLKLKLKANDKRVVVRKA